MAHKPLPLLPGVQAHTSGVAGAIAATRPDIMALVNVEGCDVLRGLLRKPELADQGFVPYLVPGTDTVRRQNVGLISKIAPTGPLRRSSDEVVVP